MKRKIVSGTMLALLLVSMLTLAFNVQLVKASGTIYIRSDGSVDPDTAPIERNGNVYTFADNIYDLFSIVVERDNIVVDGAGYTIQGTRIYWVCQGTGIDLTGRNNITIKNMKINTFENGIYLYGSSNNSISGNNITNNSYGIYLDYSSGNLIYHNNFVDNT